MIKDNVEYEQVALILKTLGDTDSLKILNQAVKGFKSGKPTIKELGITPRKYYRNLKMLTDCNMVRVYENTYGLTPLGRVLHRLLFCNLTGFLGVTQSSLDYLEEISKTKEMKIVDDYNELVRFLVSAIDKSKSEILLATNFIDFSVLQSVSNALERKVKVNTLNDPKLDYLSFFKLIEGIRRDTRPSLAKFFVDSDKNFRQMGVPFSFIVIDNEIALFEVPNKQFKIAFISTDKQIIKALTEYFGELWLQSKSLNVPKW